MPDMIISKTPADTFAAGRKFAASLTPGAVVGLTGGLGAGKTQFAKGLCSELGVLQEVTSPTFTLIHEYPTPRGTVSHVDLYRLEDESAAQRLGLDEVFAQSLCTIVEWADKFPGLMAPDAHLVQLNFSSGAVADQIREIVFIPHHYGKRMVNA